LVDSDATLAGEQTVFGDNLNISMTHVREASGGSTVVAKGKALDLSVIALAATTGATSATSVSELNSLVTVSGDIQTLNATLTSARGSGTSTDLLTTSLGDEAIAKLVVNGIAIDADSTTPGDQGNLDNLTSIKVSGSGDVTIDAGSLAKEVAKLKTIDLSGMTAFADINEKGQEVSSTGTAGGYNNLSKSTVTLNGNVAETVLLGGAKDTVVTGTITVGGATITGSSIGNVDTITGFQVVADAANPLVADATRSDVLDLGTSGGTRFTAVDVVVGGSTITANAAKMTVTGSTLEAALLQAAGLKNAADANVNNVVFHFGGDTYVYQDVGNDGLTDNDALVRMTGQLNLDLLLTSGVIIA
jgi:hypothetical protein